MPLSGSAHLPMQHLTNSFHSKVTACSVVGIGSLLWVLPLSHTLIPTHLSAHDHTRLVELFVLAAASLHWSWTRTRDAVAGRGTTGSPAVRVSIAILLALVGASALHATYPLIAVRELLLFAGLLCCSQVVARVMVRQDQFVLLLRTLMLGALLYASTVLTLMAMTLLTGGPFDPWVALIGFDNPRFLNHTQTVALPLITVVAASDTDPRWRRAALLTLVLSGMLLFLTYGRATMLALMVGLVTARWAFGRQANAYALRALLPTLLGMALMWLIYLQWMQKAGYNIQVGELVRPHHRGHLIGQAIKLWKSSPWLGVGPMHFSHWEDGDAAHPHNIYAQTLAEYGLPAALLLLGGAAVWAVKQLRALRRVPPATAAFAVGLWGALVGLAVDGGFSGNFVMPVSQLWIALAVGLVRAFVSVHGLSAQHNVVARPSGWGIRVARPAAAWVLVVLMGGLTAQSAWLCWRTPFPSMETSGPIQGEWRVVTTVNPRFWSTGFF